MDTPSPERASDEWARLLRALEDAPSEPGVERVGRRPLAGDPALDSPALEDPVLEAMAGLERLEIDEDPDARAVLADVADALSRARHSPPTLRADVRAAALAAFEAGRAASSDVSGHGAWEPVPVLAPPAGSGVGERPLRSAHRPYRVPLVLRVAAVLLVGLGLALLLARPRDAEAGPRIGAIYRVDLAAGRPEIGVGRRLTVGQRVEAHAGEVVGLRLPGRATVAIVAGGTLEALSSVAGRARLGLREGEVVLRAEGAGVTWLLPGGGALHVDHGRVRLASAPLGLVFGAEAGGRLVLPDGTDVPVEGPVRLLVEKTGPRVVGVPDPRAFAPLDLFRSHTQVFTPGRSVGARRWRRVAGHAERVGGRFRLLPSPDVTSPDVTSPDARVAWSPPATLRAAVRLRVTLVAPDGTRVSMPALGETRTVTTTPLTAGTARRRVVLALPLDWYDRLDADELCLAFAWPESSSKAIVFEEATFLFDGGPFEADADEGP